LKPFFSKHYRHIQRYQEIIRIISKHGFGYLLEFSGIRNITRLPWPKKQIREAPLSIAERLRIMLAELGPTFIKLGQILSTRPDLLPAVYISQLELLQDQVLPIDFTEIKQTLEAELGRPFEKIFASFTLSPLASASIGQVHEAFLLSGERVAVKVQRENLCKAIETDLEIMCDVAGFLEIRTDWGKLYQLQSFVAEFARTIRDELDYICEANNAERFRENFKNDTGVLFPKVYWEYTSKRVLVLEYVTGIKITAISELEQNGICKSKAAAIIANAFFKQLLIDGFFHADPHPGNLAVAKNGTIIFMDFGMVGRLEGWLKERLIDILLGIIRKDINAILRALKDLSGGPLKDEQKDLKRELYHLFDKYYNRPLKEIEISSLFRELLKLSSRRRIRPPHELAIVIRCLILLDNIVTRLDPNTSLFELAKPFGPRLMMAKFAPQNINKALLEYLIDLAAMITRLPGKVTDLFQLVTDGELKVNIEHHHFELFISRLTILGNRLSFSLIIAATIIGSSLIALKTPESLFGRFPIAEIGFVAAVIMGVWLLISIIKSGRV
jgi:ubiquinone biosynthesis protein